MRISQKSDFLGRTSGCSLSTYYWIEKVTFIEQRKLTGLIANLPTAGLEIVP